MSEPDEALLWAKKQLDQHAVEDFAAKAHRIGYRQGQAAPAERIKALEEALLGLASASVERIGALEEMLLAVIEDYDWVKVRHRPNWEILDNAINAARDMLKGSKR